MSNRLLYIIGEKRDGERVILYATRSGRRMAEVIKRDIKGGWHTGVDLKQFIKMEICDENKNKIEY